MRTLVVTLALLLWVPQVWAQEEGRFVEIDRMRTGGAYEEALDRLEAMLVEQPHDAGVHWRLSRTRVDLGELARDPRIQRAYYESALADAMAAVAVDAENAQAHLALAIAAGRKGLISGTREKVELSRLVKESVDRAIALDPRLDAAYHVRGRWHAEVASLGMIERAVVRMVYGGLPGASYEAAARDLRRAAELNDVVRHHVELGKVYLELGRNDEARAAFEHALTLPADDPDDPAYQDQARALLAELG